MKKMNPILAVCCFLFVCCAIVLLFRAFTAERTFNSFAEDIKILRGDIAYESVKRPALGDGFILYQVRVPSLNVPHQIDKMIVRPSEMGGLRVRMQDVRIPVVDALRQVYGEKIVAAMQEYKPYVDVLRHPLITLGVMDIDTVRFDLSLDLNPSLTHQTVQGDLKIKDLLDASFEAVINHPTEGSKNPVFALYGELVQLTVTLSEKGALRRYQTYAESTGATLPVGVVQMSQKEKTENMSFTFNPAISLMSIYQRKPH